MCKKTQTRWWVNTILITVAKLNCFQFIKGVLQTRSSVLISIWCDPDRNGSQCTHFDWSQPCMYFLSILFLTNEEGFFFSSLGSCQIPPPPTPPPSHSFSTPTSRTRPNAWVSPTWYKLIQMPATVSCTGLLVSLSLRVQTGCQRKRTSKVRFSSVTAPLLDPVP